MVDFLVHDTIDFFPNLPVLLDMAAVHQALKGSSAFENAVADGVHRYHRNSSFLKDESTHI